ncbi:hypothetical protein JKP88DRAFT_244220 [Tribonema minus]|uniref:Methyltransferase domain-containing protein n=1 Tax=Tribonema minus TaxID=303371 RepID=A0A835Z2P6_9STRA|nr:hypothetical protein JKP88DRAFT_244220 [Tribonema minus]
MVLHCGALTTSALLHATAAALACAAVTHMASTVLLGVAIGCAICCYHPSCRTSSLRGTEALCGLASGAAALALFATGASPACAAARALYRFVALVMGADAAWMICSFNGIRIGWFGLARHAVTAFVLVLMSGDAGATLPPALAACGFLYLSTDLLLVFEADFCANPSRQTAAPWLAFVALFRLPVWGYCASTAYASQWRHGGAAAAAFAAFAALDCAAALSARMTRWFDAKHAAASKALPPNMWVSFLELLEIAALYGRKTARGADTRARLNAMYSLSTEEYDRSRALTLFGRQEYDRSRALTLFGRQTLIDLVVMQAEAKLARARAGAGGGGGCGAGSLGAWVDIGGGTAQNLALVAERLDLSLFQQIYVVDYSDEMCKHAHGRVEAQGWTNVTVVRADAATFVPPPEAGRVSFVTMSYSLSMIPGYVRLVNTIARYANAVTYARLVNTMIARYADADTRTRKPCTSENCLRSRASPNPNLNCASRSYARLVNTISRYADADTRVVVADFFTSKSVDAPLRQHAWWRRWLLRAWFAIDDVDLAPHRRDVCEQTLSLVWETNHMGPLLNKSIAKLGPHVPYYVAVYMLPAAEGEGGEREEGGDIAERCGLRGATRYVSPDHGRCDWVAVPNFLYSYAIEDPLVDGKHLNFQPDDSLLILTTGGDNVLHWLPKVAHVTAVDMNEKQNYLLELKFAAIAFSGLPLHEVQDWLERGSHRDIARLMGRTLPYLSAEARQYWASHAYMMEEASGEGGGMNGLYLHGSYGLVLAFTRLLCRWLGMTQHLGKGDSTLARQQVAESWRYKLVKAVLTPLCHPTLMWPLMGIPMHQHARIVHGQTMRDFVSNTIDGTFVWAPWETNPYSHAFATGAFSRACHPDYLDRANLEALRAAPRAALRARLTIATAPYSEAMQRRGGYSKMVFSDHLDWLSDAEVRAFAAQVKAALLPGGLASFRSAALVAGYARAFEDAGLECKRVATHCGAGMDRLNSYASYYVIRQTEGKARAPLSSPKFAASG